MYIGLDDDGRSYKFWWMPLEDVKRKMRRLSNGKPFSIWKGWDCVYRKMNFHLRKAWLEGK